MEVMEKEMMGYKMYGAKRNIFYVAFEGFFEKILNPKEEVFASIKKVQE